MQDVPAGTNVKRWHNWYCYTVSHKSPSYPCYLVLQKRAGMARCESSRLHQSVSGSVTGLDFISGLTLQLFLVHAPIISVSRELVIMKASKNILSVRWYCTTVKIIIYYTNPRQSDAQKQLILQEFRRYNIETSATRKTLIYFHLALNKIRDKNRKQKQQLFFYLKIVLKYGRIKTPSALHLIISVLLRTLVYGRF